MHQQEILGVLRLAHFVHDPPGHGEGGNPRRADHGVDLGFGEQVEKFGEQHASRGVHNKGNQPQPQYQQRVQLQKLVRRHVESHGNPQKNGDEICEHILGGIGQRVQHPALTDEIAEHEKANQRRGLGHDGGDHDGDENGE